MHKIYCLEPACKSFLSGSYQAVPLQKENLRGRYVLRAKMPGMWLTLGKAYLLLESESMSQNLHSN